MKNRVYHCPICGKTYASLTDMYACAQKCEAKEQAAEKDEVARIAAEKSIARKFEDLKAAIAEYNIKFKGYSYELHLKHEGPTLAAKAEKSNEKSKTKLGDLFNTIPPLNYTSNHNSESKKADGLEGFLKSTLGMEEPQTTSTKKVSEAEMRKEISDMVRDEDVQALKLLIGSTVTKDDLVDLMTEIGKELQDNGLEWK